MSMPAALRRPQKNTPLAFWNMYLVCFAEFCCFQFGVPNEHACGASPTSEKTRPWNFGACTLCVLPNFVVFSLVCPMSMPAALRRPQKKHAPGILEHVPCVFCRFLLFLVSGASFGCYLVAICWFWAKCFGNWSLHVGPYKVLQRLYPHSPDYVMAYP